MYFSFSLYGNTDKIAKMLSLPPSPHSMLFGRTDDSSGFSGGKATLIRRRGGKNLLW